MSATAAIKTLIDREVYESAQKKRCESAVERSERQSIMTTTQADDLRDGLRNLRINLEALAHGKSLDRPT